MGAAEPPNPLKERAQVWLEKIARALDWIAEQIYPWILIAYGVNMLLCPEKQYVLDLMTAIVFVWIFVTTTILIIRDFHQRT